MALVALSELRARQGQQDELNWLLKATALRAFPQQQVAALHGEQWQQFLESSCRGVAPDTFAELDGLYQHESIPVSSRLFNAAEHWLRRHETTHA